ncbi:glutathion S-transferase II, GST-II, putative [Talaromyces stipitatus ATCC 10500]|uniref:glutathione transferase n=1 Tax=Talaromyces stipitatus (strain ATCC 10500 / CBS 375.48 / QM 6759 / NRRL 1006) TaxID=441959 RepID=B8M3N4_TALSN|nr:glutathion S-transferase II, GST-II, putative [Talaromyces stipitatus ATCC 10500]EED22406.1 glutathion S-transferase II, GST-II, putative [Talaromyces stipitatus ATCC 10500]
MGIVIYGASKATCTQRILATFIEKGVTDYELKTINLMQGEHKKPEYLAKHPFGVIPFMEDGNFSLHESRAISYYIAAKYANQGVKLLPNPTDLKGMATFEKWASVERDNFDNYALPIAIEKVFKPIRGASPDPKLVEHYEKGLLPKLDVFDGILAKQKYMGGDEFSLVDIYYLPYTQKLFDAGYGHFITDRPNVKAWWERVSGRESWQKVLAM